MAATSRRCDSIRVERSRLAHRGFTLLEMLAVVAIIALVIALIVPFRRSATGAARRHMCINNSKQIVLALHNYHDVYGEFPPAYTMDSNGKPLHSWRTLILPYMEENALYRSINLSKPWDDPVNAKARNTELSGYRCPSFDGTPTKTTYLAVVTPDSCLRPEQSVKLADITDGPSRTIMVIEVPTDRAVPWMSPQDASEADFLAIQPQSKLAHSGGFNVGFADGSVRYLSSSLPAENRRALITVAGKEAIELPE